MLQKRQISPVYKRRPLFRSTHALDHALDQALMTSAIRDPTGHSPQESLTPTLSIRQIDCLASCLRKSRISREAKSCLQSRESHRSSGHSSTESTKPKGIVPDHLLKVLKLLNSQSESVLNFQPYRLSNGDQWYQDYVTKGNARNPKLMQGQMHHITFDLADPI